MKRDNCYTPFLKKIYEKEREREREREREKGPTYLNHISTAT